MQERDQVSRFITVNCKADLQISLAVQGDEATYLIPFSHRKIGEARQEDGVEGVADGKVTSCPQSLVAEVRKLKPSHV